MTIRFVKTLIILSHCAMCSVAGTKDKPKFKVVNDGSLEILVANAKEILTSGAGTIEIGTALKRDGHVYQLAYFWTNSHAGFNGPPGYFLAEKWCVLIEWHTLEIKAKFLVESRLASMRGQKVYCAKTWRVDFKNMVLRGQDGSQTPILLGAPGGFFPKQQGCPDSPTNMKKVP